MAALVFLALTRAATLTSAQTPSGGQARRPTTSLSFASSGRWDDNARFAATDETPAWTSTLNLGLSHGRRLGGLGLSMGGSSGYSYAPGHSDLNRLNYGGVGSLTWSPSRRSTLTLSQNVSAAPARETRELVESGLILSQQKAFRTSSSASFTHGFSSRAQLSLSANYEGLDFDADSLPADPASADSVTPGAGEASRLVNGSQVSLRNLFSFGFTRSFSGQLGHGLAQRWSPGRLSRSHVLGAGFGWSGLKGLQASVSVGLAYLEQTKRFKRVGGITLGANRRKGSLQAQLNYDRRITEAFGFGRDRLSETMGLGLGYPLGRKLALSVAGSHNSSQDPQDEAFSLKGQTVSSGLSWQLASGLQLAAGYSFQRSRGGFVLGSRASGQFTLALSYSKKLQ